MTIFFLIFILFIINFIFYIKFDLISNYLTFFDKPDGKLKRHSKPTSLLGGLLILINLYLIIFSLRLFDIDNSTFDSNFEIVVIILGTLFYLIGLFDDLKNLTPNIKLLLLILSVLLIVYLFPQINLELIKISFLEKNYYFNQYSFLFTTLSFLLLVNAMNMFDGINLQLILFCSFVLILFIMKGFIPIFFILLFISLIFLGLLNFKNKIFLGDGGAYLLSSLLGITFIYQYKKFDNYFFGDEVFVILIIPAIDMLRLFIERLVNKTHPFKGDLNHLHHIVDNFTKNKNLTIIITIGACIIPTIFLFMGFKTYNILILTVIIYISLISYLKLKNK